MSKVYNEAGEVTREVSIYCVETYPMHYYARSLGETKSAEAAPPETKLKVRGDRAYFPGGAEYVKLDSDGYPL